MASLLLRAALLFLSFASLLLSCSAASNDTCVLNPSNSSCTNYQLPSSVVDGDISMLCDMMPWMLGCGLDSLCTTQTGLSNQSLYCNNFGIYTGLCADMAMKPCTDRQNMCAPGSVVSECNTPYLQLGSTSQVAQQVQWMCGNMSMPGCTAACTGTDLQKCPLLTTYANLCKSMPTMSECAQWKATCVAIPDWPLCSSSTPHSPPQMRMFFHFSLADYILFQAAVPETPGQFALACFAVACAGILLEAVVFLNAYYEAQVKYKPSAASDELKSLTGNAASATFMRVPIRPMIDVGRALLRVLQFAVSYSLMLIAMTFNVGLIIAMLCGVLLGNLIFGRYVGAAAAGPQGADCCG